MLRLSTAYKTTKPKKTPNRKESDIQRAYISWLGYQYPFLRKLIYKISNEGKRSVVMGHIMNLEGMRKGAPDVCIPYAKSGNGSLYIEFKADDQKPSKEQKEVMNDLIEAGNTGAFCWSREEASQATEEYLRGRITVTDPYRFHTKNDGRSKPDVKDKGSVKKRCRTPIDDGSPRKPFGDVGSTGSWTS